MRQAKSNWLGQQCPKQIEFLSLPPPALCGTNPFSLPVSDCVFFSFLSPSVGGHTQVRTTFLVIFRPIFLEWKPGGVNLNGMPLGETPLDSKFGLAHASKKEDRRTVFEASSRKKRIVENIVQWSPHLWQPRAGFENIWATMSHCISEKGFVAVAAKDKVVLQYKILGT